MNRVRVRNANTNTRRINTHDTRGTYDFVKKEQNERPRLPGERRTTNRKQRYSDSESHPRRTVQQNAAVVCYF